MDSEIGHTLNAEQIQSNREIVAQEVEALSVILNRNELTLVRASGENQVELKYDGDQNWKDVDKIKLTLVPAPTQDQEQGVYTVVNGKKQKITEMPLLTLMIDIPETYPSHGPPSLKVLGFYSKYEDQLREMLAW